MRFVVLVFLALIQVPALARNVWVEGAYGGSAAPVTELNQYRQGFLWNGTTATDGTLRNPGYVGASIGASFLFHTRLSFRYQNESSRLMETGIAGASYTVAESVNYESLFAMLELPLHFGPVTWTLGAGYGYALTYQYHQKISDGEDVIWQAHPSAARVRTSVGVRLFGGVAVFAEASYDRVRSGVKAYKDYTTTAYGSQIQMNQELRDAAGKNVIVDLSGMRFGGGLRLMF